MCVQFYYTYIIQRRIRISNAVRRLLVLCSFRVGRLRSGEWGLKHVHLALFSLLLSLGWLCYWDNTCTCTATQHFSFSRLLVPISICMCIQSIRRLGIYGNGLLDRRRGRGWAFVCTSFSVSSGRILLWQFSTFNVFFFVCQQQPSIGLFALARSSDVDDALFLSFSLGRPSTYGLTIQSPLLDMYRIFHVVYYTCRIDRCAFIYWERSRICAAASRSRPFSRIPSNHWWLFYLPLCIDENGRWWTHLTSNSVHCISNYYCLWWHINRGLVENDWAV